MKTRSFLAATAVLAICLSISACAPVNKLDPKTRWLNKQPCAAPCWENITPGVDTPADITKKLGANPLVDPAQLVDQVASQSPDGHNLHLLVWGLKSPSSGKWDKSQWSGKTLYIDTEVDKPVGVIALATPDLCLGEIIAAYGEPDTLFLLPYAVSGEVDLIWKSQGLLFNSRLSSPGDEITANVCGGTLQMVPENAQLSDFPQVTIYSAGAESASADQFAPWKGYGKYPSKFSDYAITPEP